GQQLHKIPTDQPCRRKTTMNWKAFCSRFPSYAQSTGFSLPSSLTARLKISFGPLCLMLLSIGCAVGPNYKRPDYPVPPSHRSDSTPRAAGTTAPAQTFGDVKWFNLFRDERLQELIRIALKENYDVRIAAQRVLAAQSFVTVEKSALYPSVDAVA